MISFDKAFVVVLQTICVGGLCVIIVASNADELNKSDNMVSAVLGSVAVTLISSVASLHLADQ